MKLGDWLKQKKMSQLEFGEATGFGQHHISELVNAKIQPRIDTISRIALVTKGQVDFPDWVPPEKKSKSKRRKEKK